MMSKPAHQDRITLRKPTAADIDDLARLGAETFAESHGDQYEPDDLASFAEQVFAPAAIRGEWEDAAYAFQIASTVDGRMVGYCKLGPATGEFEGDLELKQIFVRQELYGSSLGASLMQWANSEATNRCAQSIGLSVWEGNSRAIRFYEKHGFHQTGTIAFQVGSKVETDVTMNCAVARAGDGPPGNQRTCVLRKGNVPMTRFLALALALPLLAGCATIPPEPPESKLSIELDGLVPDLIESEGIAGVGIAMIDDGKVARTWYYGEQEPGKAIDAQSVFNTASVAKTVVSELYIELEDRGLIDLDARIADTISNDDLASDPRFATLTPRFLLSHSSGLRNWPYSYDDGKLAFDFAPGTGFSYSGAGIELAAEYAAALLASDYTSLARSYVLEPWELSGISTGRIEPWMDGRLNRPMTGNGEWSSIEETNANLSANISDSAADDLLATVPGYARFLEAVIADSENHAVRSKILTSVLSAPNAYCRDTITRVCPEAAGHSIGWQVNRYPDHDVVFHSGSDSGEIALVYFSPESRDGAVIFINGANGWVPMVRIVQALDQEHLFADYLRGIISDLLDRPLASLPVEN